MNRDYIYINKFLNLYARLGHIRYDGENSGVFIARGVDLDHALRLAYEAIESHHLPIKQPKLSPVLLEEFVVLRDKKLEEERKTQLASGPAAWDDEDMMDYLEAMSGYCGMYGLVV